MKTSFSGHEKFDCKMSWLPLAYKDIEAVYENIETAIAMTGLGSNKIKSLKQWIGKFTLLDENGFTEKAKVIFSNDPYLEKLDSLWILHTYITQNFGKATLYFLFFNEFFMSTFTKESLRYKVEKWCDNNNIKMSINTLESDVAVLIRMYVKNDKKDQFSSSLFSDLNLLHEVEHEYVFNVKNPASLSDKAFLYIFLYVIESYQGQTVSVKDLQFGKTSLQNTLGLTEERFLEKLEKLSSMSDGKIVYQEAAGIKQIYLHNRPSLVEALVNVYK